VLGGIDIGDAADHAAMCVGQTLTEVDVLVIEEVGVGEPSDVDEAAPLSVRVT